MIVYHVCSLKKLLKYKSIGRILASVMAWRRIILRLKFPDAGKLEGHFNQARVLKQDYLSKSGEF